MTLRIENYADGRKTVIRLSGRLQSTHLDELNTQLEGAQSRIALDLSGVVLVDVEVVRFLNGCEGKRRRALHASTVHTRVDDPRKRQRRITRCSSDNQNRRTTVEGLRCQMLRRVRKSKDGNNRSRAALSWSAGPPWLPP